MATSRRRPFLDTNVIYSAFYSAAGPPAAILRQHARGVITIVVSTVVLEELDRVVRARRPELASVIAAFLSSTPPELAAEPDPATIRHFSTFINAADAPILAAAVESRADCLVSGNTRHFTRRVARRAGIAIFTPAAYVASLPSSLPEGHGA